MEGEILSVRESRPESNQCIGIDIEGRDVSSGLRL